MKEDGSCILSSSKGMEEDGSYPVSYPEVRGWILYHIHYCSKGMEEVGSCILSSRKGTKEVRSCIISSSKGMEEVG